MNSARCSSGLAEVTGVSPTSPGIAQCRDCNMICVEIFVFMDLILYMSLGHQQSRNIITFSVFVHFQEHSNKCTLPSLALVFSACQVAGYPPRAHSIATLALQNDDPSSGERRCPRKPQRENRRANTSGRTPTHLPKTLNGGKLESYSRFSCLANLKKILMLEVYVKRQTEML